MKLLFISILISFSSISLASECHDLISLRGKYQMCWNEEYKAWVSSECQKAPCDSVKFFKAPPKKFTRVWGSDNPGSVLCKFLKNKVEILRDKQGNEQSYCVFPDGSMADTGAMDMVIP